MAIALDFFGAAGTVTGSCVRLVAPGGEILVDCGLFQGPDSLRALNWRELPFAPDRLAAVVLTHAHVDHSGLFPRLVREGFHGSAWGTPATCDLLRWVLPDSGAIQEADVERRNRRLEKAGRERVAPIYTRQDAERSLERLRPRRLDDWFEPAPGMRARFRNAGHILGAAFCEIEVDAKPRPVRIVFSGDIGPPDKALQLDPAAPGPADVVALESTYGDRVRPALPEAARRAALRAEIAAGLAAGGNIVVPAFAVERTQELLADLMALMREGRLPAAQVFVDSPLASRATDVFARHAAELDLPRGAESPFRDPRLHFTDTVEQSKAIGRIRGGAIVLAGSGMCEAGRVKHHLKGHLWRTDATVLFCGYQAPGTLGDALKSGAPRVRIHGEEIAVRARIRSLEGYSGHADRDALVAWARPAAAEAGAVFLVHGEPPALDGLGDALVAAGVTRGRIHVPAMDQRFLLRFADGRWTARATRDAPARRLDRVQAAAVARGRDWHNDYAETVVAVREALERAGDDRARQRVLDRMRRALGLARR